MVPQDKPVKIKVGKEFLVERNLPGQRMGAKSWYILVLRNFMEKELQCQFCVEQPSVAKSPHGGFLLHIDDILFCGHAAWWKEVVVPQFQKRITISYDEFVDE